MFLKPTVAIINPFLCFYLICVSSVKVFQTKGSEMERNSDNAKGASIIINLSYIRSFNSANSIIDNYKGFLC